MGDTSEAFESKASLRHEDDLYPVLFNFAPEKVIRDEQENR